MLWLIFTRTLLQSLTIYHKSYTIRSSSPNTFSTFLTTPYGQISTITSTTRTLRLLLLRFLRIPMTPLAKEATNDLNSDITTFDPTPFSTLLQATISYDSIPTIDTKLRPLLRDCFDASHLAQLFLLKRFSKYLDTSLVDWEFMMLLFKHKLSHGTSSSHQHITSTVQAFCLKLFYDELPTMQNLAVRRPDLYRQFSACYACNLTVESLPHLCS